MRFPDISIWCGYFQPDNRIYEKDNQYGTNEMFRFIKIINK